MHHLAVMFAGFSADEPASLAPLATDCLNRTRNAPVRWIEPRFMRPGSMGASAMRTAEHERIAALLSRLRPTGAVVAEGAACRSVPSARIRHRQSSGIGMVHGNPDGPARCGAEPPGTFEGVTEADLRFLGAHEVDLQRSCQRPNQVWHVYSTPAPYRNCRLRPTSDHAP